MKGLKDFLGGGGGGGGGEYEKPSLNYPCYHFLPTALEISLKYVFLFQTIPQI